MILYQGPGAPHARFKGEKSVHALKSFIINAMQHAPAQPQQGFMQPQGNMYSGGGGAGGGGGSYSQQQMSTQYQRQQPPLQGGQGGPGPSPQGKDKFWMPELGKTPTMTGALRGGAGTEKYAYLGTVDDEDDEKLLTPDHVIPHNEPWMSQYKKLGTMD